MISGAPLAVVRPEPLGPGVWLVASAVCVAAGTLEAAAETAADCEVVFDPETIAWEAVVDTEAAAWAGAAVVVAICPADV
jgi:hypothetical protein